jgi:hypothetical protein
VSAGWPSRLDARDEQRPAGSYPVAEQLPSFAGEQAQREDGGDRFQRAERPSPADERMRRREDP